MKLHNLLLSRPLLLLTRMRILVVCAGKNVTLRYTTRLLLCNEICNIVLSNGIIYM
jgi:hypothetical protein